MIQFDDVHKWFRDQHVLAGVNLLVRPGTLLVLCGESGAGKSTLISTVNGLEPIQRGTIRIDGVPLSTRQRDLRNMRRQIGVVYQSYNLFGHLTVEQNIRLGLEQSLRLDKTDAGRRADHNLDRVGLSGKKGAYPGELSGGQQQRVAIARSLAMQPKILLMDEPTSALDVDNAADVVATIRSLRREGMTIVLATHQVAFFADIADEFACMEHGRVTETGTFSEVYARNDPGSRVAGWLNRRPATTERPREPVGRLALV